MILNVAQLRTPSDVDGCGSWFLFPPVGEGGQQGRMGGSPTTEDQQRTADD